MIFIAVSTARANRDLSRDEILSILKSLTAQPQKTWMTTGSIIAKHQEFRAARTLDSNEVQSQINAQVNNFRPDSNDEYFEKLKLDAIPFNVRYKLMNSYTMDSTVTIHVDGEKFYWQIEVDSRKDSIKPSLELANNYMTDQFDLNGNRSRIFVWNGQQYSTYMRPVNHAIVTDAEKNSMQPRVSGPLVAGFIPWGFGNYTYEKLSSAVLSATEIATGCQKTVQFNVRYENNTSLSFILDPSKNYAVLSHTINNGSQKITVSTYGNFQAIGGRWIPTTISIEQYKGAISSQNLAASDFWDFTSVIPSKPSADLFAISYEKDAMVEYRSFMNPGTLIYYHSDPNGTGKVNTDDLLIDKLAIAGSGVNHNCGSAAMKYVCQKLGKSVSDQSLVSQLIKSPDTGTSLYDMKILAQGMGLYATIIQTDLNTLKTLQGCQIILHLPQQNHFVVLGDVDNEYARTIDLTSNKFYIRYRIWDLSQEWTGGTALVISASPIEIGNLTVITDNDSKLLLGKAYYSCSRIIQYAHILYCQSIEGACNGNYEEYFERKGCKTDVSGSCTTGVFLRYRAMNCIDDIYVPGECDVDNVWQYYYMTACG